MAGPLIPVRVGDIESEVEAVRFAGTEATSGLAAKAAGNVLEALGRPQDVIVEVARSTAGMIEKAGAAARPDRVEVEFGLKFSASGGVIMAEVAGGSQPQSHPQLRHRLATRGSNTRRRSGTGPGPRAANWDIVTAGGGSVPDGRVPGYLGRVLDNDGDPVGTCFQVAPGVLVTAWHVLDDVNSATEDAQVQIDPLPGGDRFSAAVRRVDPERDLAVLVADSRLPTVVGLLTPTDQMAVRAPVTATGHAMLEDQESTYRFLTAVGHWAGGTTRNDAIPLGPRDRRPDRARDEWRASDL